MYRPTAVTPKPLIYGPQTAMVVGSSGEEIQVDKLGRVNVQFFWDRHTRAKHCRQHMACAWRSRGRAVGGERSSGRAWAMK